ncbi:CpsB/CapC family capsule biosynthesis tyrosine phosphatase [Parapedobacter composti]|nr:CpsB/CapC family capsule biosynthesis tyrosine phosphatase [Parapedobacter composti]
MTMFKIRKKYPFTFKDKLTTDFGLSMAALREPAQLAGVLQVLPLLGVQQAVVAAPPDIDTAELPALPTVAGLSTTLLPTYWLDESLEAYVRQHPLDHYDKFVLFTLRDWAAVGRLKGALFEVRSRGYTPVILHHEPKAFAKVKPPAVGYLVDLGCLFQLNVSTLAGKHGKAAKAHAEALLAAGHFHLITTGIRSPQDTTELTTVSVGTNLLPVLDQVIAKHAGRTAQAKSSI